MYDVVACYGQLTVELPLELTQLSTKLSLSSYTEDREIG